MHITLSLATKILLTNFVDKNACSPLYCSRVFKNIEQKYFFFKRDRKDQLNLKRKRDREKD